MMTDHKLTTFERRVLQVMLDCDPGQSGSSPEEIASHVWKPLGTVEGRFGQVQAMRAQLLRMRQIGFVEFGSAGWFLTGEGLLTGKRK